MVAADAAAAIAAAAAVTVDVPVASLGVDLTNHVDVGHGLCYQGLLHCFFLLRDAFMHSAVLAVERWLAVTRRYCV